MGNKLFSTLKILAKTLLKIVVSGLALYLVYRKIDINQLVMVLNNINWLYLVLAFILANASQWASALRLKQVFKSFDIDIEYWYNLRLYYKGMFYNLFLPGGIGGDGAKVVIINRQMKKPAKDVLGGLLNDRVAGLSSLLFLGFLAILLFDIHFPYQWINWLPYIGVLAIYPAFYLFIRIFFKKRNIDFISWVALSLLTNLVQTLVVLAIFLAIGVTSRLGEYLAVFYIANAALAIPFTIGGMGGRELIFVMAPAFAPIDGNMGVIFSLLFFVIAAINSLAGAFIPLKPKAG